MPINVVIGRNNSGKSALLDIVEHVSANGQGKMSFESATKVVVGDTLESADLTRHYPAGRSGGLEKMDHAVYAGHWIGKRFYWEIDRNHGRHFHSAEPASQDRGSHLRTPTKSTEIARSIQRQFLSRATRRLLADRDIRPEPDNSPSLRSNGQGATNLIQNFLNKASLDRKVVENDLLGALNEIFHIDGEFLDIVAQQLGDGTWEVFLEEETKGLIPLSASGSGLKTVILCLCNLLLIPVLENSSINQYVFLFEELENNLHPALQRRLLRYIARCAIDLRACVFFSTHSSVAIDMFATSHQAQIIHVQPTDNGSVCAKAVTYVEHNGILDDLDVRASDLLQANAIVWVEGPTDRLYLRRWIDLWSDCELVEGEHYICLFYGGRLLAHLTAESGNSDWINVMRVNRHMVVLIDSDKKYLRDSINDTKKRIVEETKTIGGYSWITKGREIENYIPHSVLASHLGQDPDKLQKLECGM